MLQNRMGIREVKRQLRRMALLTCLPLAALAFAACDADEPFVEKESVPEAIRQDFNQRYGGLIPMSYHTYADNKMEINFEMDGDEADAFYQDDV